MKASELMKALEKVEDDAEVILVVYTEDNYVSGYMDRVDTNVRYNSVTKQKLEEDERVVELTTSTGVE